MLGWVGVETADQRPAVGNATVAFQFLAVNLELAPFLAGADAHGVADGEQCPSVGRRPVGIPAPPRVFFIRVLAGHDFIAGIPEGQRTAA